MDEQNNTSNIETLDPQDTGLIKQQGWQLTQIFCLEEGDEDEIHKKAMELATKLAAQFKVAIHEVDDIEFKLLEIYTK